MRRNSEAGFTLMELLIATATLLIVMSGALHFFSKSQVIYNNERETLNMIQELRMAFDRFTNEVRMAGAGLPGYHGVVSGTETQLIVRGDFNETTTVVTSAGPNAGGVFSVGSVEGFSAGQTVSLLNPHGASAGASALTKITSINASAGTMTLSSSDLLAITSGATINSFGPGTIISVIERRTYRVKTGADDPDRGAVTRAVAYESAQTPGATILAEEIIARNILTAEGSVGLKFTYLDASDNVLEIDPATGLVDASKVAKVRIELNARTGNRDLESGQYRTLKLTALIQVRGQYIPAVGF